MKSSRRQRSRADHSFKEWRLDRSTQFIVSCFILGAAVVPLCSVVSSFIKSSFARVSGSSPSGTARTVQLLVRYGATAAIFAVLFSAGFLWQKIEPEWQEDAVGAGVVMWFFVGLLTYVILRWAYRGSGGEA